MKGFTFGITAIAAGLLVAASASAAPVIRAHTVNAAGACNGALPSYEGELRKRPLGVQNEGTAPAFVTCSLPGDFYASANLMLVAAFTNQNAAPVDVNCTFVDGMTPPFDAPAYYPQTITVAANGANIGEWLPPEGQAFSSLANVSCSLPAGVALNVLEVAYVEDNGVDDPV
ncbi:hypothetical protein [Luteimonas sp. A537]